MSVYIIALPLVILVKCHYEQIQYINWQMNQLAKRMHSKLKESPVSVYITAHTRGTKPTDFL